MAVLFLGGLGRSGTTLMERLLGELPGICPLGEVVHLWSRGLLANERCGCGAAFRDCPFWQEVGKRAFGGWEVLDTDRVFALKSRADRTRFVPELATSRLRAGLAEPVRAYAGLYHSLYEAVRDFTGCDVVVDSSKHASLAYCLRWCPETDLRVLHVVRDSRAVAYSWTKRVRRPEGSAEQPYMARLGPVRAATRWNTQNGAFDLLGRLGVPVRRVRYEDLLADPAGVLTGAAGFAGLPVPEGALDLVCDGAAQLSPQHTVSGNPMRFETGRIALRPDDAWRMQLPVPSRRVVTALTAPTLARYGYPVTSRNAP